MLRSNTCLPLLTYNPQAKKKPLETVNASDLGVDVTPRNIIIRVEEPPVRKAGILVDGVDSLVDKLKNEAGVIQAKSASRRIKAMSLYDTTVAAL